MPSGHNLIPETLKFCIKNLFKPGEQKSRENWNKGGVEVRIRIRASRRIKNMTRTACMSIHPLRLETF